MIKIKSKIKIKIGNARTVHKPLSPSRTGKINVNVLPWPTVVSTASPASIFLANSYTIESPKPVDIHALKRTVESALKECGERETVRQFEALERSHRVDALDLFSRSTDRLARQNRIRELVGKSKERPNISALARQFSVARRTIIRDLQELIRRGQLKPEVYPEWENDEEQE